MSASTGMLCLFLPEKSKPVLLAGSFFSALRYIPSARGSRASCSAVEVFEIEQPGAAMYLGPASFLASIHCLRISSVVNLVKSISSTPPRIGWKYSLRTSEIGIPLTFTEY